MLSKRRRGDVDINDVSIRCGLYVFDLISLNRNDLIYKSLKSRKASLYETIQETPDVKFADHKDFHIYNKLDIASYMESAISSSTEGLMLKRYSSIYEINKRSTDWLKVYILKIIDDS